MHFYRRSTRKNAALSEEGEKYVKFTANDTLAELEIEQLHVFHQFYQIIDSTIFIFSMQFVTRKEGYEEDYFLIGGRGMAMYVEITGHYIILFNENQTEEQIRWTISRLIHLVKSGDLKKRPNEFLLADYDGVNQSDAFAYQITRPDIILTECGIQKADDIIKHCRIPFFRANRKSSLLELVMPSKLLKVLEKNLKKKFYSYIHQIKTEVLNKMLNKR